MYVYLKYCMIDDGYMMFNGKKHRWSDAHDARTELPCDISYLAEAVAGTNTSMIITDQGFSASRHLSPDEVSIVMPFPFGKSE